MELLLALTVITAVIIFGALLSIGNERHRRAIDELREQLVLWAIQDLRVKREHLAREVRVDDPLEWLNRIAAKVCGFDLKLELMESFENPRMLICSRGDGNGRIVFTPLSPHEIRRVKEDKKSRLSQITTQNPLEVMNSKTHAFHISVLNGGVVFDLELPVVWAALTGQKVDLLEWIWAYVIQ